MPDYFFTFGQDHTHPTDGRNLRNHYVRITARTSHEARNVMIAHFGIKWAMQYNEPPKAEYAPAGELVHLNSPHVDELLAFLEVNKAGYAGVMPGGTLVDRREHPEAIPVPENSMMNVAAPRCVPCGGSGMVPTHPEGEPGKCEPCNGTGLWIDHDAYDKLEAELQTGQQHAEGIVHHLLRMGAGKGTLKVEFEGRNFLVCVEEVNPKPRTYGPQAHIAS